MVSMGRTEVPRSTVSVAVGSVYGNSVRVASVVGVVRISAQPKSAEASGMSNSLGINGRGL